MVMTVGVVMKVVNNAMRTRIANVSSFRTCSIILKLVESRCTILSNLLNYSKILLICMHAFFFIFLFFNDMESHQVGLIFGEQIPDT
jgi:hypothetical protein